MSNRWRCFLILSFRDRFEFNVHCVDNFDEGMDRVVIDVFYEEMEEWIFIVINCRIILFCEILSEF